MVRTRKKITGDKHPKRAIKNKNPVKEKKHKLSAPAEYTDHQIPVGYNLDTIVIMPVNIDTSFIYWEVTDRLLKGNLRKLKTGSALLMIKVLETDCLKEVCSFEVKERIGKNYINYQPSFRPLVAEIGIMNGSGFIGLLRSRIVSSPSVTRKKYTLKSGNPSTAPSLPEHDMWMTIKEDKHEIVTLPFSKGFTISAELMEYYHKTGGQQKSIFSAEFTGCF